MGSQWSHNLLLGFGWLWLYQMGPSRVGSCYWGLFLKQCTVAWRECGQRKRKPVNINVSESRFDKGKWCPNMLRPKTPSWVCFWNLFPQSRKTCKLKGILKVFPIWQSHGSVILIFMEKSWNFSLVFPNPQLKHTQISGVFDTFVHWKVAYSCYHETLNCIFNQHFTSIIWYRSKKDIQLEKM